MSTLDRTQLETLQQKLCARQATLREEVRAALLASSEARHREIAGMVSDAGDDSVADLLADVNLKGMDRDARELAEITAALDRMARGEYGECIDCGSDIGYPRLDAHPTARRCIECETLHERQYGAERGGTL